MSGIGTLQLYDALPALYRLRDAELGYPLRALLEETAVKVGPKSSYKANGHSNDFGYGRVNAARAVAQARRLAKKSRTAR